MIILTRPQIFEGKVEVNVVHSAMAILHQRVTQKKHAPFFPRLHETYKLVFPDCIPASLATCRVWQMRVTGRRSERCPLCSSLPQGIIPLHPLLVGVVIASHYCKLLKLPHVFLMSLTLLTNSDIVHSFHSPLLSPLLMSFFSCWTCQNPDRCNISFIN